jgi:hypothetical protein
MVVGYGLDSSLTNIFSLAGETHLARFDSMFAMTEKTMFSSVINGSQQENSIPVENYLEMSMVSIRMPQPS